MKMLKEEKAQGSLEFLLMLGGVVLIAAIVGFIIKKTVIRPLGEQVTDVGNKA